MVSLVDVNRQWFKSKVGIDVDQTHRDVAFCSHAILESATNDPEISIMVVNNALEDDRFKDNPLVTGPPYIRFYAGATLKVKNVNVGTLCIIDTKVCNDFSFKKREILKDIAAIVAALMSERHMQFMDTLADVSKLNQSVLQIIRTPLRDLTHQCRNSYELLDQIKTFPESIITNQHISDPDSVGNKYSILIQRFQDSITDGLSPRLEFLTEVLDVSLRVAARVLSIDHKQASAGKLQVIESEAIPRFMNDLQHNLDKHIESSVNKGLFADIMRLLTSNELSTHFDVLQLALTVISRTLPNIPNAALRAIAMTAISIVKEREDTSNCSRSSIFMRQGSVSRRRTGSYVDIAQQISASLLKDWYRGACVTIISIDYEGNHFVLEEQCNIEALQNIVECVMGQIKLVDSSHFDVDDIKETKGDAESMVRSGNTRNRLEIHIELPCKLLPNAEDKNQETLPASEVVQQCETTSVAHLIHVVAKNVMRKVMGSTQLNAVAPHEVTQIPQSFSVLLPIEEDT